MTGRSMGLALALVVVLAGAAPAHGAAPQWRLDALANTTVPVAGTLDYLLQVTNVGDQATTDPWTLTATLAPHMTVVSEVGFGPNCVGDGPGPAPSIVGATTISCERFALVQPHSIAPFTGGEFTPPILTVAVDPSASGLLTSSFELAGGPPSVSTVAPVTVSATVPGFGPTTFDGQVDADAAAAPFTQAGGHPFSASTSFDLTTFTNPAHAPGGLTGALWPVEPVKDAVVDLPPGFVGFPAAAAKCTAPELGSGDGGTTPRPQCASTAQVGTALVRINGLSGANVFGPVPVFNMVPPPDVPARFGFNVAGTVVTLDATVRSGSDYGVSIQGRNISQGLPIAGTTVTLWGVPADSSHDNERACAGLNEPFDPSVPGPSCTSGAPRVAFVRNPTSCQAPAGAVPSDGLTTTLRLDSWAHPGAFGADGAPDPNDPNWKSLSFVSHLPAGYPSPRSAWGPDQLPTGCEKVPFDPTLAAVPASPARAGSPSGFTFDLNLPQSDDPDAIGEADLRNAVVTLPAGVRVSPSSADGLGACSPDQIALHANSDPTCPESAKVGSLTITTPLLEQPLAGSVYLATPHQNPFDSLIAIYLVAKGPGVVVKLAGRIDVDQATGQLTATFNDQPQLPFSNLHLEFKGGARAPLVTPKQCGTYTTHTTLTSWSGKTVNSDSSFTLSADGNGAPCPPSTFSPGFIAGTQGSIAGSDKSFLLRLTRSDRDQELSALTVDMPTGLLGRIANAVLCPDAAANAGTCQDVSKIGGVTVGAGAGTNPFYISTGRVYITGPYKGAPYGLSIVVPAVAGPFDLGDVVVRTAIFVDRQTAALRVVSDPLPTILQGIPLDVRDVRVAIDKPHFIVNPTSCAPKQVAGTIVSTQGAVAHVASRFQALECAALNLAPKISMTVGAKRHTRAGVSTPFSTTLTQTPGQTNLRSVSVTLPGTLNALLPVVNRACKLTEYEAGRCGAKARVGSAVAVTPLLRDPLRGSVYFVKNAKRPIPDIMVALRGPVSLDLTGKVSIPGGKRLATRFDTIPDAPITKFTLRLVSGKNGPVGTVSNLCSAKSRAATAAVGFRGQNGMVLQVNPHLRVLGCPRAARAGSARKTRRQAARR